MIRNISNEIVDKHLDAVLRASGSALRHYSMPSTIEAMRSAMYEAIQNIDDATLQLKSLQLTELQVAEIASRHGTINDFGKTFFTDSELYDFVHEFLQTNSQRAMNVVRALPMENGDGQA